MSTPLVSEDMAGQILDAPMDELLGNTDSSADDHTLKSHCGSQPYQTNTTNFRNDSHPLLATNRQSTNASVGFCHSNDASKEKNYIPPHGTRSGNSTEYVVQDYSPCTTTLEGASVSHSTPPSVLPKPTVHPLAAASITGHPSSVPQMSLLQAVSFIGDQHEPRALPIYSNVDRAQFEPQTPSMLTHETVVNANEIPGCTTPLVENSAPVAVSKSSGNNVTNKISNEKTSQALNFIPCYIQNQVSAVECSGDIEVGHVSAEEVEECAKSFTVLTQRKSGSKAFNYIGEAAQQQVQSSDAALVSPADWSPKLVSQMGNWDAAQGINHPIQQSLPPPVLPNYVADHTQSPGNFGNSACPTVLRVSTESAIETHEHVGEGNPLRGDMYPPCVMQSQDPQLKEYEENVTEQTNSTDAPGTSTFTASTNVNKGEGMNTTGGATRRRRKPLSTREKKYQRQEPCSNRAEEKKRKDAIRAKKCRERNKDYIRNLEDEVEGRRRYERSILDYIEHKYGEKLSPYRKSNPE